MKNWRIKNGIKCAALAAGAILVAAAAYVAFNSFDCAPPDMSKFDNHFEVPSDADNVYCGLVAVTNVISEKTGLPILVSLFCDERGRGPIQRFPKMPLTDEDKDAILTESSKALAIYHEAVRRKTWWACDPAGKREPFPRIGEFWRLCVLVHLEAQRRLELGEANAAIYDVGDMLLLARKIENDAESVVRWHVARLLVEKAADIAMKIAKSEKSTDEDIARLQAALARYDVASRPERVQRMLNNEVAVYFSWLCDPEHGLDPDDLSDDGGFSRLLLRIPFLAPYTYHRNHTLNLFAGYIERIKQGLRSGYDKAAWEKVNDEMFDGLSDCCFAPNFSGCLLLSRNLRPWGQINDFQNGSKWYDAVESALAAARLRRQAEVPAEPHLYMAGDSIMADYTPDWFPQYGWGQALKAFMKDPSHLHNFARSGWSARRFRESGRWEDCIASKLNADDWVIVSFGHNDMNRRRNKLPKTDYSTPEEYKAFLRGFASDARAKGANIAFATSIAHSSGFCETNGVMRVDGGATGLGTYVAAMREVAAEVGAPLLDLNRYAEENLPKMGLDAAKSLYMVIKPGEYPNYPEGKNDPAHIRYGGAFFYAKAAVEMAREQGLSLARLWKGDDVFNAVSQNGLNELRLDVGDRGMEYSVWRKGKALVEPTRFSISVKERGTLNGAGAKPEITVRKIDGMLATPLYKKSSVDLAANETRVDFGDWAVVLHARNDGVAWRFETKFDGEITVNAESTNIRFPKGAELCYTQEGGFMSGWEKPAKIGPVESVSAGHPQIVMTPFTATVSGAGVVTVAESNLLDYPGLNFYRKANEPDTLRSWQAGVPKDVEKARRKIKVVNREPYLAKTSGTRVFPWRVFVLGDSPSDLVSSDAVYALAEPSRVVDVSWVKPGQVAWDWWNGFLITDVPGLKTGCNFETYKEYVNFAAANGIAYIIMDEGWSEKLDLDRPRGEVNVPGVIAYAKEKGVGVILWAAWSPLADRETRIRVFDSYAAMGAKGFKIDFIERDDQIAEKFLEETAADAAERKLVVMYHGIHKPTGLQRTYPNILNYEGVYGLEQGHSIGGRKVVVSNDVNLVYTRMVAGFMDYTPGAMRNRAFDAPPFDKTKDAPACYGTRCHQLALFPLFEAPIQMLCDSPTQYRTEPECTAFLTKVPTVWDETRGVAGEIGKFASVARRKCREWWLGAITNWEARDVALPTDFLGGGEWRVEAFEDAPDAGTNAEHYVRREFTIKAGEPLKVRLVSGGGFAARLVPMANGK